MTALARSAVVVAGRDDDGPTTLPALTREEVAAHRAAWTAALRSGAYRQAQHELRSSDDGYCCLGVAEDVRGARWRADVINPIDVDDPDAHASWCVVDRRVHVVAVEHGLGGALGGVDRYEFSTLTGRTQWWLGLRVSDPVVAYRHRLADRYDAFGLVALNDDVGLTLAQIADVVDDQPVDWDGTRPSALRDADHRNRPTEHEEPR